MKVIFLDIDNVLNTDAGIYLYYRKTKKNHYIDPKIAANLTKLCNLIPSANIVISSMWRGYFSLEQLRDYLKDYVNPEIIIDKTLISRFSDWDHPNRGKVIANYLEDHPKIKEYVILDDLDDKISDQHKGHFVHVNPLTGLTSKDVHEAFKILMKRYPVLRKK